ncbi:MAG TPA: sigma 54-interacting transcriptional regulator, partial [Candidatus Manganitrophaceae bacterium]
MTAHSDHHDNLCPSILDGISDEIIVIDREYNLIYGNKSVQGKFGDGHREGEKCYAVLHGEEKPCDPCPCQEAFKTGKPYRIIRKKDVNGQGPSFLKEFRAYPIFDQTGQVIRVVEVIQDISPVEERPAGGKASDACSGSSGSKKEESLSYFGMIGASKKMKALFHLIRLVSPSHATVLVYGESGTGKEMVAQAIHQSSPRRRHPFIAIDCGALPETLLESELFGHVKGAFTGAIQSKKGLFEEAEGGTLFLDEIGELPFSLQPKLLRALDQGEIRRVGATEARRFDVRVIAATNRDLEDEVGAGR